MIAYGVWEKASYMGRSTCIVPVANSNLIHNLHSKTPWYLAPGKQNKVTPLNPLPRIILTDPSSAIEYAVIGQRLHINNEKILHILFFNIYYENNLVSILISGASFVSVDI